MTYSYNSCAERERVIVMCSKWPPSAAKRVNAAELLSEYGCQCVRCDGCTQRVSTFFWTPLYIRPLSVEAQYSRSCPIFSSFRIENTVSNSSIVAWFPLPWKRVSRVVYRSSRSNSLPPLNAVIAPLLCRNLATDNFFRFSCHNIFYVLQQYVSKCNKLSSKLK
jgi:hypothetical protein